MDSRGDEGPDIRPCCAEYPAAVNESRGEGGTGEPGSWIPLLLVRGDSSSGSSELSLEEEASL